MIRAQDWLSLPVPSLDAFKPALSLTVIVPVRDSGDGVAQSKLDLTLASLACQDYPAPLLRVIVVDDGSSTPVRLPAVCPPGTSLLRLEDESSSWGKARAFNAALSQVDSDLVMSLDADMLLHPSHLRAASRFPHADSAAVALGYKRMVTSWNTDPVAVASLLAAGCFDDCADGPGEPHAWFEDEVEATGQFTAPADRVFKAFVGATVMLRTDLLRRAGGYDPAMRLAEDTELGYRLYAAGAVFVPVKDALAWHLGLTTMDQHRDAILAHNHALLAPRVPAISYLRRSRSAIAYPVAHVLLQIPVGAFPQQARELAEAALSGALGVDAHVRLLAPAWPSDERYSPRTDDASGLRALRDALRFDGRVTFATDEVDDPFPHCFLLDSSPLATASSLKALLARMNDGAFGVVAVTGGQLEHGEVALWRTAALSRARLAATTLPDDRLERVALVDQAWGSWWVAASSVRLAESTPPGAVKSLPLTQRARRRVKKAVRWRLERLARRLR